MMAVLALSCAAAPGKAGARTLPAAAAGYEVQVLVDGVAAPTFSHRGDSYVLGRLGERYTIRVLNRTGRRVEAVVSVDGRDVIDGRPADFQHKRGYLIDPWGQVEIDGWRLSLRQVAAFRFARVADSYAARTGSARHVGVIGVALFPERIHRPRPLHLPHPAPPPGRHADATEEAAAPPAPARAEAAEAPAASGARGRQAPSQRPGLGTEFGEAVASDVRHVAFVRANATTPAVLLGVRYDDRRGLIAQGIDVDAHLGYAGDPWLRRTADPFPVSHGRYAAPPPGWRR
jgi:hypothetical protein